MTSDKKDRYLVLAACLLAAGIFIVDLWVELGHADWVMYMAAFLLAAQVLDARGTIAFVGACSVLTLSGYYLAPHGLEPAGALFGRAVGMGVFWVVAWLVIAGRRTRQAKRNHAILQSLLKSPASGMVCVKDLQGKVILANPAMLRMLGRTEAEVIGTDDLEGLPNAEEAAAIRATDRRVIEEGVSISKEETIGTPGGQWTCLFQRSPLHDASGRVVGILGVGADITERKLAEERLRVSEAQFRLAFENARDAILWADADTGELVNCNQAAEVLLGRSREEILGQPQTFLHPSEGAHHRAEVFRTYIQSGAKGLVELDVIRKDGSRVPVEISGAITEVSGQRIAQGIFRDITERKQQQAELEAQNEELRQAQESLVETRDRFVDLYDSAPVGYFTVGIKGHILAANLTGAGLLGMDRAQLPGRRLGRFVAEEDLGRWDQFLLSVLRSAQRQTCELAFERADGSSFHALLEAIRLDGSDAQAPATSPAMRVTMSDRTERKRAERALVASERKYRRLHETMTDAFVLVGMDGRIQEFNKTYHDMLGYEPDEMGRLTYLDITPAKWHEFEGEIVRTQILPRGHSDVYTKEYRRKDGSIFPVELRVFLQKDHAGEPEGMWAIVRDITDRRAAETALRKAREDLEVRVQERTAELAHTIAALRESESRFRGLFATVPDAIIAYDAQTGQALDWNEAAMEMFGYTPEEFAGVTVFDISAEPEKTRVSFFGTSDRVTRLPLRYCRRKDGTRIPLEIDMGKYLVNGRSVVCGVHRDITERLGAQQQLVESREELRSVLASMDDLLFTVDLEGRFVHYYQASESARLYVPAEAFLGKHVQDVLPPETAEKLEGALDALQRTRQVQTVEYSLDMPGGRMWFSGKCSLRMDTDGKASGITVVVRDVTERRLAEQKLHTSEAMYRALVEATNTGYLILDSQGRVIDANAEYVRMTGHARLEEILGRKPTEWTAAHDLERNAAQLARCVPEGSLRDLRIDYVDKQGNVTPVEIQATVIPGESDCRILSLCRDVTGRVRNQAALAASEARFRGLFEQAPVSMWELDFAGLRPYVEGLKARGVEDLRRYFAQSPDAVDALLATTRVVAVNEATVRMHETPDKAETMKRVVPAATKDRKHMVEARIRLLEGQTAFQTEARGTTAKGKAFEGLADYLVLPGHEEKLDRVLAVITDITAIKEAQASLQIAHRRLMTAVEDERGRLAKELHDSVAQDLVALELSLRCAASGLAKQPTQAEAAKAFETAIGRCNGAVREIRGICRGLYPPALETFGLPSSLEELARNCSDAGLPARLRVAPDAGDRRFGADIEIAVFRIAQEAVNNALRHSKAKRLSLALEMDEGQLTLSVADNGKGIPSDGKTAAGLGMVSMRERSLAVGGELRIDSHKKGTTVTLRIPLGPAGD